MARSAVDAGIALCASRRAGWGGAPGGQAVCCRISRGRAAAAPRPLKRPFPVPRRGRLPGKAQSSVPLALLSRPALQGASRSLPVCPSRAPVARRSSTRRRSRPSAFVPLCRPPETSALCPRPAAAAFRRSLSPAGPGILFSKKGKLGINAPASLFRVISNPFEHRAVRALRCLKRHPGRVTPPARPPFWCASWRRPPPAPWCRGRSSAPHWCR